MADIKVPIKIDGFKCIEDMVQAALNYSYKGRTLKEWADSIAEPQTNADRIRQMSDEELAEWATTVGRTFGEEYEGYMSALDWLKQEVTE